MRIDVLARLARLVVLPLACAVAACSVEVPAGPGASADPRPSTEPPTASDPNVSDPPATPGEPATCAIAPASPGISAWQASPLPGKLTPIHAAVDGAGRVLVGGWAIDAGRVTPWLFAVRYTTTGAVDTTFGDDGLARLDVEDVIPTESGDFAVDERDGVIMRGRSRNGTSSSDFVVRLDATGKRDVSFGSAGLVRGMGETNAGRVYRSRVVAFGTRVYLFESADIYPGLIPTTPEHVIVGHRVDGTGNADAAYRFTMPASNVNDLHVAASDDVLFVGNGDRLTRLDAVGAPEAAFGSDGIAVEHRFLVARRDRSAVVASSRYLRIIGADGSVGTPSSPWAGSDAEVAALGERCDGLVVVGLRASAASGVAFGGRVLSKAVTPIAGQPVGGPFPVPAGRSADRIAAVDRAGVVHVFATNASGTLPLAEVRVQP